MVPIWLIVRLVRAPRGAESASQPLAHVSCLPAVTHARVFAIAGPMMLANLTTPLLGVVATAVIGRLGEAHLLGAVALAAVVFDCLFWLFGFLRMGTVALTAQALGAGDVVEQRAVLLARAAARRRHRPRADRAAGAARLRRLRAAGRQRRGAAGGARPISTSASGRRRSRSAT